MNKILPIILVVVLSGCASIGDLTDFHIKWADKLEAAYEKCKEDNSLMIKYVECRHKEARRIGKAQVNDAPFGTGNHYAANYLQEVFVLNVAKKYHMVIAEEVDAGRASWVLGEAEITSITIMLREKNYAMQQKAKDNQFQKSLQFLDIYSKAIERTTPKAPQTIIVPKY